MLHWTRVEIGENTVIGNFCEINSGTKIGADTLINSHCHLNSNTRVGNGVIFGSGVLTADEKYMTSKTENIIKKPCVIGNDCRIGQKLKPHLHDTCRSRIDRCWLGGSGAGDQVVPGLGRSSGEVIRNMNDHEIRIGSGHI